MPEATHLYTTDPYDTMADALAAYLARVFPNHDEVADRVLEQSLSFIEQLVDTQGV